MARFSVISLCGLVLVSSQLTAGPTPPNIVVIMTDDLSVDALNAVLADGRMPQMQTHLIDAGMSFSNSFATDPICCPSRATFFTGQYTHNHGVLSNLAMDPFESGISWPGWFPSEGDPGLEAQALATWLQSAGYQTAHIGKYLNGYGNSAPAGTPDPAAYVPPGWDNWQGLVDPYTYKMYEYQISDNGVVAIYGSAEADYQTDVLAGRAVQFINGHTGPEPFFLNVAPLAPHIEVGDIVALLTETDPLSAFDATVRPAPRHLDLIDDDPGNDELPELPAKPSLNEADVSDKVSCPRQPPQPGITYNTEPDCVGDKQLLAAENLEALGNQYKAMLASMIAVDDMIGDIVSALDTQGFLDNTVIIFTSDNGWFFGEHRLSGKSLSYDESARVPLIVRGPQIAQNVTVSQMVLNNDLAPTIAALAGATPSITVDGTSFTPVLYDANATWFRRNFLVENWFIPGLQKFNVASSFSLRSIRPSANFLYITVYADPYAPQNLTGTEFYNLLTDPYAMQSLNIPQSMISALTPFLDYFRGCSGQFCKTLEGL